MVAYASVTVPMGIECWDKVLNTARYPVMAGVSGLCGMLSGSCTNLGNACCFGLKAHRIWKEVAHKDKQKNFI